MNKMQYLNGKYMLKVKRKEKIVNSKWKIYSKIIIKHT